MSGILLLRQKGKNDLSFLGVFFENMERIIHIYDSEKDRSTDVSALLPTALILKTPHEIALTDVYWTQTQANKQYAEGGLRVNTDLIACDVIDGDHLAPLLSIVRAAQVVKDPVYKTVTRPYIDRIRIWITDAQGAPPKVLFNNLFFTVQIREK